MKRCKGCRLIKPDIAFPTFGTKSERRRCKKCRAKPRRYGPRPYAGPTPAERQVFELMLNGLHDKEIARRCGKCHLTVGQQICRVVKKLGARTRPHAVALYLKGDGP